MPLTDACRDCFSVDGIEFDARDDIFYTKEQTERILAKVKELRPVGCDDLIPWLERAVAEYDGIGFDGI